MAEKKSVVSQYMLHTHTYDHILNDFMCTIASLFSAKTAYLTFIEDDIVWVKAAADTPPPPMPISDTFCERVWKEESHYIVENALDNANTCQLPSVLGESNFQFYAGVPFYLNGTLVGSLCLLDDKPRRFKQNELKQLFELSEHFSQCVKLIITNLKTDEEHQLLNASPAAMIRWVFNPAKKVSFVSENLPSLFGLKAIPEHLTDFQLSEFIHKEDLPVFHEAIQNHKFGTEVMETDYRIITRDKQERWVKQISRASFDERNKLSSIHAMLFKNDEQKYLEARMAKTNERMRLLLESSGLGTWDWDILNDIHRVNTRWCKILGLDPDDTDTSGMFWQRLIHPADRKIYEASLKQHFAGQTSAFVNEYRMQHAEGHWLWIETYARVVARDENGDPIRLTGTHRDITDKKHIELETGRNQRLLRFITNAQNSFVAEKDLKTACGLIFDELLELAESEYGFIGRMQEKEGKPSLHIYAISDVSWSSSSRAAYEAFERGELAFTNLGNLFGHVITSNAPVIANKPPKHHASKGTPDGHPPLGRFLGLPISRHGEAIGMIGLANKAEDYSEADVYFLQPLLDTLSQLFKAVEVEQARYEAEQQLQKLASTDPLTALMNRRAYFTHIEQMAASEGKRYGLAILDVDNFKQLNDTYGHPVGDEVLIALARAVKSCLRDGDVVARLGGEEFGVFIDSAETAVISKVLEAICDAVRNISITTDSGELNTITASIGVTITAPVNGPDTTHFDIYMKQADDALYQAKSEGKNQVKWFEEISMAKASG